MVDKLSNKPVTPDREMLELLKDWVAPDVTDDKKQEFVGRTNFLGVPIDQLYSKAKIEVEDEEEEIKPLTAEEIEQIRQDAYDEGFAQGKEEGFIKGEEEGLQQGHAQGLQQGHDEGFQTGLAQGQEEVNILITRWNQLSHQLFHPLEKLDKVAEQQLLNLAVMLAETVIRHESKVNKEALFSVLDEAIASLPFNTEFAEIHMHPEDIELLKQVYDEETLIEKQWIIKEEPGYKIGDVIVMTPNSLIDRTVKQRIKQTLDKFINKAELEKEIEDSSIASPEFPQPNLVFPAEPEHQTEPSDEQETIEQSRSEQNSNVETTPSSENEQES